jgi:dihydroorotate dehydrogenase (NAD+) catalytic subunit
LTQPDMQVRIGRLIMKNPVMVASGTFGFGEEYAGLMDVSALGGIVTKGVSLNPREGNASPRIVETPSGLLNAVGLQNPGLERFIADKVPLLRTLECAVVVNIFGETLEEYAVLSKRLDAVDAVDALEVNISCPNVKQGGMAFGTDPQAAYDVAKTVRENTGKPVLVKLSPNVTDIVQVALRVKEAEVDGLTLINTLRGMAIDYRTGRPILGNVMGGLSGPAIRPVAVRMVYEVNRAVEIPLVGCGGIVHWQDAVEMMRAGASAVQVGSATFRNPRASLDVLEGVERFLRGTGIQRCKDLVGTVQVPGLSAVAATEGAKQ